MYGVLEKQFGNYFVEANRQPGKTGDNLLRILELRLDNVVFRAGFAKSPRHGTPVGHPRSLHGERQEGRHPVLPRLSKRRHRGAALVPEK